MLDVRTIFITTAVSALLMAVVLFSAGRILGRTHNQDVSRLINAYMLLFSGFALNGYRGVLPDNLAAGIGSACWSFGTALMAQAIVNVRRLNIDLRLFHWFAITQASITILLVAIGLDFQVRTVIFSIGHGAIFAFNGVLLLLPRGESQTERWVKTRFGVANIIAAIGMFGNAASLFSRALFFYIFNNSDITLLQSTPTQIVLAMMAFAAILTVGFGFFLLFWQTAEEKLLLNAATDALTGALNRRAFRTAAEIEMSRSTRSRKPFCVAIFDLDHFKKVNDTYGHAVGDEVIKLTADVVTRAIRKGDVFARYGGEEFVLLFPETDIESARLVAERILTSLRDAKVTTAKGALGVTASVGLAQWDPDDEIAPSIERLTEQADQALYKAKEAGRNRCIFWEGEKPAAGASLVPA